MKQSWKLVACVLALGLNMQARAQTPAEKPTQASIDMQQLTRETQISRQHDGQMNLVWWMPKEFWEASLANNPNVPQRQRDDTIKAVEDYLVFAIVDGTIGGFGSIATTSKEELLPKLTLTVGDQKLEPIQDADLAPNTRGLFQIMKPTMANMLGPVGQGMQFIAFKGRDEQGNRLGDPFKPGGLTLKIGDKEFKFRLPVGALLPPKIDASSGEQFPGNYEFNPYTGKKLRTTK